MPTFVSRAAGREKTRTANMDCTACQNKDTRLLRRQPLLDGVARLFMKASFVHRGNDYSVQF